MEHCTNERNKRVLLNLLSLQEVICQVRELLCHVSVFTTCSLGLDEAILVNSNIRRYFKLEAESTLGLFNEFDSWTPSLPYDFFNILFQAMSNLT